MVNVSSVRDYVDDDVGMTIKSGITLDHCQLCGCVTVYRVSVCCSREFIAIE